MATVKERSDKSSQVASEQDTIATPYTDWYVVRNAQHVPCSDCGQVHEFYTMHCAPILLDQRGYGAKLLTVHEME